METPTLYLKFIRNAYTKREGKLETVGEFPLAAHPERDGFWAMASRKNVLFPTGDTLEVYSEINPACNYVHIYHGEKRWVSWKAAGDIDLMFLLPGGEEAYVSLVVTGALK